MKQKKTMELWQFIVMVCLLLVMLITMFIPMFNFTGNSMIKGTKKVFQKMDLDMLGLDDSAIDKYFQQIADEVDEKIKNYEEEYHVRISSISPWKIMTNSFVDFLCGDIEEKDEIMEEAKENEIAGVLQRGYNSLRVIFWAVYVLLLFVLILNIVGFFVKFVKYISLGVNIFCGLFTIGIFSYLRFGVLGAAVERSEDMIDAMGLGYMTSYVDMKALVKAILSGLYVRTFTILILTVSALFIIGGILFMFIGNNSISPMQSSFQDTSFGTMQNNLGVQPFDQVTVPMTDNYEEESLDSVSADYKDQVTVPMMDSYDGMSVASMSGGFENQVTVPMTEDNLKTDDPIPEQSSMGRVWVIKGIAKGQGFMLPQNRKVVVGKSMQNANLIINNLYISNIHCSIRYNPENSSYIVKDHSSNGTFVNGIRLQKGVAMEYPAGTVLSLADGQDEIQLG